MARINTLDVLLSAGGNDYLAEVYGQVIENIAKEGITSALKNTALSGSPASGTLEAKRFENRTSNAYGTARTGGAGQSVKDAPVTIAIDQDKELITEIEAKDVSLYGVDNFIERQSAMDQKAMNRELERAFFAEAKSAGTQLTLGGTTIEAKAEEMIQAVETVSNNFVDGVDRDDIALICTPAFYGQLRTYMDKVNDGGAKAEAVDTFHGVDTYSSVYLPSGAVAIVMAKGSIAQPVLPTVKPAERIPLTNAVATGLFYSYGTKATSSDLIFWA